MRDRTRIYIMGPITHGDWDANKYRAMTTWDHLIEAGYWAFCPHWSCFQHRLVRHREDWLALDDPMLDFCDVGLRLPGVKSSGSDYECDTYRQQRKPVFVTLAELLRWVPINRDAYLEVAPELRGRVQRAFDTPWIKDQATTHLP